MLISTSIYLFAPFFSLARLFGEAFKFKFSGKSRGAPIHNDPTNLRGESRNHYNVKHTKNIESKLLKIFIDSETRDDFVAFPFSL